MMTKKLVHAISCFLSEADEMQYIGTPRIFPQVNMFFNWRKARGVPDDVYCTLENDVIHVH
jgi:hypothetical protein